MQVTAIRVFALARVLLCLRYPPPPGLTLDLLRSELSHETSSKVARLAGLVGEWRRGRYHPDDPSDAQEVLNDIERILLRYAHSSSQTFRTWVLLVNAVHYGRQFRAGLTPRSGRSALSLTALELAARNLDRLRNCTDALTDALSHQHAERYTEVVNRATDEIRRESCGGSGAPAVPLLLDDEGTADHVWVPRADAHRWHDILVNLLRNAVQATEDRVAAQGPGALQPVQVLLDGSRTRSEAVVEIVDHGTGLTPPELERMWIGGWSRHGMGHGNGLTEQKRDFVDGRADLRVETAPGSGTRIRIAVEGRDIPIRPVPLWAYHPIVALALVLVAALVGLAVAAQRPAAIAVRVVGQTEVAGIDSRGRVVWHRDLGDEVVENFRAGTLGKSNGVNRAPNELVWLRDAKGRNRRAMVSTQPPSGSGAIVSLDPHGRLLASHRVGWMSPHDDPLGKLVCNWIAPMMWDSKQGEVIAFQVRDSRNAPSATQFFAADGESLGAYYHYGHLQYHSSTDLDGDGRSEVLLFGVNNRARLDRALYPVDPKDYIDCVILLEVPLVSGQAWPWDVWEGIPPAREEGYLLLPPLKPGRRPEIYGLDVGEGSDGHKRIEIVLLDGRVYRVDEHLRPTRCIAGDHTTADSLAPFTPDTPLYHWSEGKRTDYRIAVE